jgi:tripartite-type tricarboxylate transporter receptor subunit TctC
VLQGLTRPTPRGFAIMVAGILLGGVGFAATAPAAAAQVFPTKNIMLVIPFPAGGRSDITIRLLTPYLEKELGQPVVILNKPGGGSSIGFRYLAQAQPDGYMIGLNTNAVVTAQYTVKDNLDLRNYEPIALINSDPAVMAVSQRGRWTDVRQLIEFAKQNPQKILVGINPGASAHIFAAAFLSAAGIQATLVPYKGGSERVAALAGGHIDADFGVMAQYRPMLDSKGVRVLAVASDARMPSYPNIPTFKEKAVDLQISGWQGFFAPKGVPAGILKRLNIAVEKVLTNSEVVQKLKKIEIEVDYKPPHEFAKFLQKEDAEMRKLIKALGLMVASPK